MITTVLTVETGRRPLTDLTEACVRFSRPGGDGLLNVFAPHGTCGLALIELGAGSDDDLLAWLDQLLPRTAPYRHRHGTPGHGRDHLVPALLPPTLTIPVVGGRPELGSWQHVVLVDTNPDNPVRRVRLTLLAG